MIRKKRRKYHVKGSQKKGEILLSPSDLGTILKVLDVCDLVGCNCH